MLTCVTSAPFLKLGYDIVKSYIYIIMNDDKELLVRSDAFLTISIVPESRGKHIGLACQFYFSLSKLFQSHQQNLFILLYFSSLVAVFFVLV